MAQAFEDDFAYVRKKKNFEEIVMRLKLEFHPDADELAKLPWEYLYAVESDGSKGRFIAAEEQLVLTRFVPLDRNYPDDPDDRRLRILAAVSAPVRELTPDSSPAEPDYQDLGPIKADPVISQLTSLEKEQPDRFQVKKLDSPTQRALADCVGEFKPHVLHFIGHGKYGVRHDEGYLAMIQEDDRETACWVDDESFADCFREWPPPLVFLQACEGARTESYNIFRGMALRLVASSIGAVVAMQYQVENKVANAFAGRFYKAISQGEPIDQAVQTGRRELGLYIVEGRGFSSRAFGSPVVFLQTADGIIDEIVSAPLETYEPLPCPWGCQGFLRAKENFCPECHRRVARCPKCDAWNCVQWSGQAAPRGNQLPASSGTSSGNSGSFAIGAVAAFFCTHCGYDAQAAGAAQSPVESMEPAEPPKVAGTLNAARDPATDLPLSGSARLL